MSDVPRVMEVLAEAKRYMEQTGNPQWRPGYPSVEAIERDMAAGAATTLLLDGAIGGYMALAKEDAAYDASGLWEEGVPYRALHRLALGDRFRGRGLATDVMEAAARLARAEGAKEMRIDTGEGNRPMQRLLTRCGYTCLGHYDFPWGPRLAYVLKL